MKQKAPIAALALAFVAPARAQNAHPWAPAEMVDAAKAEGALTVYSSMNEQEGLPLWKLYEQATGVTVSYVRASDVQLLSRIAIEARARRRSWDVTVSTAAMKIPPDLVARLDPPEARAVIPAARGPDNRWLGVYAHYNAPAYNTSLVRKEELPKTLAEFAARTQWKGRVAIDTADSTWLSAIMDAFGEDNGRKIVGDLVANLSPVLVDGHLQLARAVASGEYLLALSNYVSLTLNLQLSGAPTDFFGVDATPLFFGAVAANAQAPHPAAARLAANFLVSVEAQEFSRKAGRLPVRPDVTPNPPDAITRLSAGKIVPVATGAEEERKWQKVFQELFRRR
jgi:iron(III) transport system substrate-binding protein